MRLGKQGVDLLCRLEHFEKHFAEPLALDVAITDGPSKLSRGQNSTWIGLCTNVGSCPLCKLLIPHRQTMPLKDYEDLPRNRKSQTIVV